MTSEGQNASLICGNKDDVERQSGFDELHMLLKALL